MSSSLRKADYVEDRRTFMPLGIYQFAVAIHPQPPDVISSKKLKPLKALAHTADSLKVYGN
jgi:hypothetical protein